MKLIIKINIICSILLLFFINSSCDKHRSYKNFDIYLNKPEKKLLIDFQIIKKPLFDLAYSDDLSSLIKNMKKEEFNLIELKYH